MTVMRPLEHVIVKFSEVRPVFTGTKSVGFTNKRFEIERGNHTFHLGQPANYKPAIVDCDIKDTAIDDPLIIDKFTKKT